MFLITVIHDLRNRLIKNRFQHSGQIVHKFFHEVLVAMMKFSKEMITPSFNDNSNGIANHRLRQIFKHSQLLQWVVPGYSREQVVVFDPELRRILRRARRAILSKYQDPRNPTLSNEFSMWVPGLNGVGELWVLVVLGLDLELEDIYGVSRVFCGGLRFLKSFGFLQRK
ncbi:hypothetical protein QYF36_018364 [Acer negundo]|nr:hypothetical protein QYF36_018364 [Acer negundo]